MSIGRCDAEATLQMPTECTGRYFQSSMSTRILAAITDATRAVILNSPNNPTGAVILPVGIWNAWPKRCAQLGVLLVCDEAYEIFVYDGIEDPVSGASVAAQLSRHRAPDRDLLEELSP